MKSIILLVSIFFTSSLFVHAQIKTTSIAYQSTKNNTYKYEYYNDREGNKKVEVFNVYDPFEGQPGVELNSQSFSKVTSSPKKLYDIVSEALSPYLPKILVGQDRTLFISLKIGLNGKVGHVTFVHFTKYLNFPAEAYEAVETAIKNEYKLTFQYDPNNIEGVYTAFPLLFNLKEKTLPFQPVDPGQNPTPPGQDPLYPGNVTNPGQGVK